MSFDKIDDAILSYQRAIKCNPHDGAVINNLAMVLLKRGTEEDIQQAVMLSSKLRSIFPNVGNIVDTYGWALYHQGRYKEADQEFEYSINIDPDNPYPYYHRAKTKLKLGQEDVCFLLMETALRISTTFDGANEAVSILDNKRRLQGKEQ